MTYFNAIYCWLPVFLFGIFGSIVQYGKTHKRRIATPTHCENIRINSILKWHWHRCSNNDNNNDDTIEMFVSPFVLSQRCEFCRSPALLLCLFYGACLTLSFSLALFTHTYIYFRWCYSAWLQFPVLLFRELSNHSTDNNKMASFANSIVCQHRLYLLCVCVLLSCSIHFEPLFNLIKFTSIRFTGIVCRWCHHLHHRCQIENERMNKCELHLWQCVSIRVIDIAELDISYAHTQIQSEYIAAAKSNDDKKKKTVNSEKKMA